MANIGDPNYEAELAAAMAVADAIIEATKPQPQQDNSTTVIEGTHYGVTHGTHYGDMNF
ncbi:hypothetical protein [Streptomyces bluensis]|uniref:hypothetical protein n=1 Tax=Streptomyces bluensis TaxID=33897 RepID=UPI00332B7D35